MMKVFVLINEQDTDASNQSTVQLFLDKEAARAEMRKQFKAELPSWNVDAENLTDDQECECGEDTAVIRWPFVLLVAWYKRFILTLMWALMCMIWMFPTSRTKGNRKRQTRKRPSWMSWSSLPAGVLFGKKPFL